MPLLTLDHVSIAFSHLPLLDDASLQIDAGERVAIIGRNGTGKSTLLQLISGELPPDRGAIWRQPGVTVARLVQDVPLRSDKTVFDVVADGLGALRALVTDYHHAAAHAAEHGDAAALDLLGRAQQALEKSGGWSLEQRIELVLSKLDLDADARIDTLSGGWRRRVLLAQALVAEPSVLLLDEPTNHLDIDAIEWLESLVLDYKGAIVFVTHDRAFLQRTATRIVELDRGALTSWPGTYASFLQKKDERLATESLAQEKFDKLMAKEEAWLRRGVKARRTRDEGRVRKLMAMREARAARREQIGAVRMTIGEADRTGQVVFELEHVSKTYGAHPVIRDFSTRVMRGDRIGLIGPNGSGKTTLLGVMLGTIAPDPVAGVDEPVRVGANVQVAYYDQQREQLDPDATVADAVGGGNDTVIVNGQPKHVHGYLEDFLFPPERARSPVKALSGGERNRLLLARLFTRPANVLVLDEPTNDLDIETLELLEQLLADFAGTILLVSHDRQFLNDVVTSTISFEGDGVVRENVGNYDDWKASAIRTSPAALRTADSGPRTPDSGLRTPDSAPRTPDSALRTPDSALRTPDQKRKLTYNEQREFDGLPARIEALEREDAALAAKIASTEFYKEPAASINGALARVEALKAELAAAYGRWAELGERA